MVSSSACLMDKNTLKLMPKRNERELLNYSGMKNVLVVEEPGFPGIKCLIDLPGLFMSLDYSG